MPPAGPRAAFAAGLFASSLFGGFASLSAVAGQAPKENRFVDGVPIALLASVYQHVSDSDGATSKAEVELVFDRRGVAFVAEDIRFGDRGRAQAGTYTFRDGHLTLHFGRKDSSRDAVSPLVPGAKTMTLPFKLLSPGRGTSRWERPPSWDVDSTVCAIYWALRLTQEDLEPIAAMNRAANYAKAFLVTTRRSDPRPDGAYPLPIPRLLEVRREGWTITLTNDEGLELGIMF